METGEPSSSGRDAGPRRGGASRVAHVTATLAFLALAVASATARSVSPAILGRYSAGMFAYQVLNVAALGLMLAPSDRRRLRWAGYALVVASTFLVPINEAVRRLPLLPVALPTIRLLVGIALVAAEFDRFRRRLRPVRGLAIGAGVALLTLSALDLALAAVVAATSGFDEDYEGFRDSYDLASVTPDDVVLVGDSFVWGHGVARVERFGDVLQSLYARAGRGVRVFSLGVRGAGPRDELESLARIPEGRRAGVVILAFYPNDLEPRPAPRSTLLRRLGEITWSLGRSSLTFRVLHDGLGRIETPSLDAYHRAVVDDYRRDGPSFAARWAGLVDSLGRFAALARRRSAARPLLVILPLMVDYRDYPLAEAHADLARTAEGVGFDVLDLLPAFRGALGDGSRHRVRPGDNHFDARVHALVASALKARLDARPDTARLGLPGVVAE